MKAVVTGGAGFIGSHLVDRLIQDGHEVLVLDNLCTGRTANLSHLKQEPKLKFFQEDISNLEAISGYFSGIDWVFHLAALADIVPSITEPYKYHQANVGGTIAVLEAARRAAVKKFIYAASSSCYGIPAIYPTAEDAEISPQYPYAFTKYLGEQYCLFWAKVYKIPVVSLRLFNVYGPRSRTSGAYGAVLGVFLAQKLHQQPFTVVGDGSQKRDFIYVTDVASAFAQAAASAVTNEVFNVGSGRPQSVNRLAELLGGQKVYIPRRPGEPECTWAQITKTRQALNWQPEVSFEEGIALVLKNIDYWKDAPLWTPEKIADATKAWFKCLTN